MPSSAACASYVARSRPLAQASHDTSSSSTLSNQRHRQCFDDQSPRRRHKPLTNQAKLIRPGTIGTQYEKRRGLTQRPLAALRLGKAVGRSGKTTGLADNPGELVVPDDRFSQIWVENRSASSRWRTSSPTMRPTMARLSQPSSSVATMFAIGIPIARSWSQVRSSACNALMQG